MIFILSSGTLCQAQRVVADARTTAQVIANTAMQFAVEYEQNAKLDSVKAKNIVILAEITNILACKELYLTTLSNCASFGAESLYYKEITKTITDIGTLTPQVFNAIKKATFIQQANAIYATTNLIAKGTQLVNDFVNIVANSKIENPLKKLGMEGTIESNDKANLLDRRERYKLASTICYDLKCVKRELNKILYLANSGDWGNLISQFDPKTWAYLNYGKSISESLGKKWNRLTDNN